MQETLTIKGVTSFDLCETLHCGQTFSWTLPDERGACKGVLAGRMISLWQEADCLIINGDGVLSIEREIRTYFDLDRDYNAIRGILEQDPILKEAIEFASGIRILRQDPWQTLASFLFSSNNNIARIRGIVERFCALFGEPAIGGGYCFPTLQRVLHLSREDLSLLKCGYRDTYLLDAADKIYSGEVNLHYIYNCDIDTARRELMKIRGVGPKVAGCVLLFGFHRLEAFPIDVHIGRAMKYFPCGLPEFALPYAGIAQQYLFHWMRLKNGSQDINAK